MNAWLSLLNESCKQPFEQKELISVYAKLHVAFVRIHPFYDGNGRLARLLANFPVLISGMPPIMIAKEKRRAYIHALSRYELAVGPPESDSELIPEHETLGEFSELCNDCWQQSLELVDEARKIMRTRVKSIS